VIYFTAEGAKAIAAYDPVAADEYPHLNSNKSRRVGITTTPQRKIRCGGDAT
jgi:hypothetical protein